MSIEETITKAGAGETDAIIHLGELVESSLKSEFGGILKALTTGKIAQELSHNTGLSAERVLGRLEMANSLWDALEQFVLDKDKLLEKRPTDHEKEDSVAQEPVPQRI